MASFRFKKSEKNPVIKVGKNMRWMKGRYRRMKKTKTKKKLSFSLSLYDIIVGYDWYCLYNSVIRLVMYSVYLKNHPSYVLRLSPPALHYYYKGLKCIIFNQFLPRTLSNGRGNLFQSQKSPRRERDGHALLRSDGHLNLASIMKCVYCRARHHI
jgi:hypothetical protein